MLERKYAEGVSVAFKKKGIELSVENAVKMTPIESDCYQIYAIQIQEITYISWIYPDKPENSFVKTVKWRGADLL